MASNRLGRSGEGDRGRRGHSPAWPRRYGMDHPDEKGGLREGDLAACGQARTRTALHCCCASARAPSQASPSPTRCPRPGTGRAAPARARGRAAATPPAPPLFTP